MTMDDALEEREFYELMQAYRHHPLTPVRDVCDVYEAVKTYVRVNITRIRGNGQLEEPVVPPSETIEQAEEPVTVAQQMRQITKEARRARTLRAVENAHKYHAEILTGVKATAADGGDSYLYTFTDTEPDARVIELLRKTLTAAGFSTSLSRDGLGQCLEIAW